VETWSLRRNRQIKDCLQADDDDDDDDDYDKEEHKQMSF
jgi:hypothetical protein